MAVTSTDLATEVGAADDPAVDRSLSVAESLVGRYLTEFAIATPHGVPDDVLDQAVLAVAVDEFNRRQAPNGVLTQYGSDDVPVPIRVSSDPLRAARPLLSMWCMDTPVGGAV